MHTRKCSQYSHTRVHDFSEACDKGLLFTFQSCYFPFLHSERTSAMELVLEKVPSVSLDDEEEVESWVF